MWRIGSLFVLVGAASADEPSDRLAVAIGSDGSAEPLPPPGPPRKSSADEPSEGYRLAVDIGSDGSAEPLPPPGPPGKSWVREAKGKRGGGLGEATLGFRKEEERLHEERLHEREAQHSDKKREECEEKLESQYQEACTEACQIVRDRFEAIRDGEAHKITEWKGKVSPKKRKGFNRKLEQAISDLAGSLCNPKYYCTFTKFQGWERGRMYETSNRPANTVYENWGKWA